MILQQLHSASEDHIISTIIKMKAFIVLLALVALVAAEHHEGHLSHDVEYVVKTHDDLVQYRQKCVSKLHVPAEHVEKYKKWEFPDDEISHCYMKCIFEEFGIFDETHGFDVKKVHHQLAGPDIHIDHNNETHAKIEQCADKNTQGSDACTWAYRGGMCFIKENLRLVQHSVSTH